MATVTVTESARRSHDPGLVEGNHDRTDLILSAVLYTTVLVLILMEIRSRTKPGPRASWPGIPSYVTLFLCCLFLGTLSCLGQLASVPTLEYFHRGVLLWMAGTLVFILAGRVLRKRAATHP